mmetsp:Transcript_20911/g.48579  ORF Transcript_20911/g.48579 Transcript_20911/m.48579 type:complete len:206 (+) Transcript_20911:184-801(+)
MHVQHLESAATQESELGALRSLGKRHAEDCNEHVHQQHPDHEAEDQEYGTNRPVPHGRVGIVLGDLSRLGKVTQRWHYKPWGPDFLHLVQVEVVEQGKAVEDEEAIHKGVGTQGKVHARGPEQEDHQHHAEGPNLSHGDGDGQEPLADQGCGLQRMEQPHPRGKHYAAKGQPPKRVFLHFVTQDHRGNNDCAHEREANQVVPLVC